MYGFQIKFPELTFAQLAAKGGKNHLAIPQTWLTIYV